MSIPSLFAIFQDQNTTWPASDLCFPVAEVAEGFWQGHWPTTFRDAWIFINESVPQYSVICEPWITLDRSTHSREILRAPCSRSWTTPGSGSSYPGDMAISGQQISLDLLQALLDAYLPQGPQFGAFYWTPSLAFSYLIW